jgi:hypothetical protein
LHFLIAVKKSFYYMSNHTFFCLADGHYVFLDLRSDEYLCLGRKHTNAMKALLNQDKSIDILPAEICLREGESDCSVVVQALLKRGLLVKDSEYHKSPERARIAAPSTSIMEEIHKSRPRVGLAHALNFFAAAATASKNLRCESIERTVRGVEARKLAHATAAASPDMGTIGNLFHMFHILRPYYPRRYLCLFDSLALLHFLARYRMFPNWVYGVKLEPFAAHCWVQAGDKVVNDIIDNVRDYTPIMSI